MTEQRFVVSDSDENFSSHPSFATRDEAIAEGKAVYGGKLFYTGEMGPPEYPTISGEGLLEDLVEEAVNDAGEFAEGWFDQVTSVQEAELEKELNEVLERWMDRHGHRPKWFTVSDIEAHQPERS